MLARRAVVAKGLLLWERRLRHEPRGHASVRPCGAVDEERMAEVHVPGVAGCIGDGAALDLWRVCCHLVKGHAVITGCAQLGRDQEMRTNPDARRCVVLADIAEQHEQQERSVTR